jgi:hypothetical protein
VDALVLGSRLLYLLRLRLSTERLAWVGDVLDTDVVVCYRATRAVVLYTVDPRGSASALHSRRSHPRFKRFFFSLFSFLYGIE